MKLFYISAKRRNPNTKKVETFRTPVEGGINEKTADFIFEEMKLKHPSWTWQKKNFN